MGISLLEAEILALFLEALLYGVLISLYCGFLLVMQNKTPSVKVTMISIASVLLALATVHMIIDVVRALHAFVLPSQAFAYYDNFGHPLFVAKSTLYITQTLLGDGVIVWRCYVVFDKQWKVITIPGTALLANACVGYYVCYAFSQARVEPGATFFHVAEHEITTFFSLTMTINVLCTAAIAWRILMTHRFAKGSRYLLPVIIVVVETGALYSTALCGVLITYIANSNGQYPALDIVQPLVGIVFILIALQTHYHCGSSTVPGNSHSTAGIVPRYHWTPQGPHATTDNALYPMRSLAVQISEETTVNFTGSGAKKDVEEASV
ncbi:hypothetical protein EVG20_g1237 [Dentipellis fragilis]|uniref:Uncharacterized protein n=1 Tax=Dentipellis fragilis TaxID=205917 RepID=A0A4Y9ZED8_9AGAM|nr:hypothetical protein EVG20_g1237 [Dentipellis fragilis]